MMKKKESEVRGNNCRKKSSLQEDPDPPVPFLTPCQPKYCSGASPSACQSLQGDLSSLIYSIHMLLDEIVTKGAN